MNILITSFTYPPNKDGVSEACRLMAEGLAGKGWNVTVATGNPEHADASDHGNIRIERFALEQATYMTPDARSEAERYRSWVMGGDFDVVVNHCWEVWPTTLLHPCLKSLRARTVLISHGFAHHTYVWHPGKSFGIISWLKRLKWTASNLLPMIRRYDRLVFLTRMKGFGRFFDHTIASWAGHGGIEFIPNCSATPETRPDGQAFRQRYGIGNRSLVLCVANYCERKNQKLALKVFRQAAVDGSVLVFIGSELGEYGKALIELNATLKTKSSECDVIFLENLSRSDTCDAFAACDLFLLTAKSETQPIVLIEAMAAGKPWLSTATGCVREMPGGLVRSRSRGLTSALRQLLEDKNLRNQLGAQGASEAAAHFSTSQALAKQDRLCRSLVP